MVSHKKFKSSAIALFVLLLTGCITNQIEHEQFKVTSMSELHELTCKNTITSSDPWSITNLYDCRTRSLFIPYQLWTGSPWKGDKQEGCMHKADSFFVVDGDSETTIKGPESWFNPAINKNEYIWIRDKVDGSKTQYFTCHDKGIGRVYDSRGPRYYKSGRCKFPAGFNWQLNQRGYCEKTSIEIIALGIDETGALIYLDFRWWYYSQGKYILDHIYRYVPNYGMQWAWKQV